jgi:hypothetical protein
MPLRRQSFAKSVTDFGSQRTQRHRTANVFFAASHFGTAQSTGQLNLDSFGTGIHRLFGRSFHRPAEAGSSLKLFSNLLSDQLSVQVRSTDFFDLQVDPASDQVLHFVLQPFDFLAFLSDDQTGASHEQRDFDLIPSPLNFNAIDPGGPVVLGRVFATKSRIFLSSTNSVANSALGAYQRLFQPSMTPVRNAIGFTF